MAQGYLDRKRWN